MKFIRIRCWAMLALIVCVSSGAGQTTVLHTFAGNGAGDSCGVSVASAGDVDGDGTNDIVAGHGGAPAGTYAGRVRVYSGVSGAVIFTIDGAASGDQLGYSVDGAGDVNGDGFADIIVGVPGADGGGTDVGLARVYAGPNGAILHTFTGTSALDHFGASVSGAGDVNADGYADLVVGAYGANSNGLDSGSVRVYSGLNGAQLFAFNGSAAGDWFGYSVHGAGDVNNDGMPDLILGAPAADTGGPFSGNVRVISGMAGAALFIASGVGGGGGTPGDLLGYSVAAAGDVNNDGFDDVIAGGPGASNAAFTAGSARVFGGPTGTPIITFSGSLQQENLGYSVGRVGDVNGDGRDDLLVGSYTEPTSTSTGVVRIYSGQNGVSLYSLNGSAAGDSFGQSVAGVRDLNADGRLEIAVGAPLADQNGASSGRVVVLTLLPAAQTALLGPGCGGPYLFAPLLNTATPRLGTTMNMSISFGPSNAPGVVVMSVPPAASLALGSGCTVFVDPVAFTQIATVLTGSTGMWLTPVVIPNVPAWAGLQLAVQGFFPGVSAAPLGFALTGARLLTLGY